MNIVNTLAAGQSKSSCEKIVRWIGNDQKRFDELVALFLQGDFTTAQRAGWPLSEIVELYPLLVQKHLGGIIYKVKQAGNHEAVKRNTVRLLQYIEIPEEFHGEIMDLCFNYIMSPTEKPAVKAFSLTILQNLAKIYPDIKHELKTVIEERWDFETAAFHSRARKILNR